MENNIELFDRYVGNDLSQEEKVSFDRRLKTDPDFSLDFKTYLMAVRGVCQEARQDNFEFGHAMKKLSREDLLRIIGRTGKKRKPFRLGHLRERMAWAASVAAILIVGIAAVYNVQRSASHEIDNLVFAYNYVPAITRSSDDSIEYAKRRYTSDYDPEELKSMLPELKRQYADAPEDDVQARQDAGMRLAMAYLKLHDRKMARQTLTELRDRFSDDEFFVAKCNKILSQIK